MKCFFYIFILSLSFLSLSQEGYMYCSRLKSHQNFKRSNILSVQDIQKTEKYDVHHYFLDLNMSNLNTNVFGNVEIHAKSIDNISEFVFELHSNFTITNLTINGVNSSFTRNTSGVYVPVNIQEDSSFICSISYNGTAPDESSNPLGNAGLTSKSSSNSWGKRATWSLSEPFSAYEWFPCKQSLKDKIDSTWVFITVDSNLKAGSNGLLVNDIDLGNGKHRMEWKTNYPIVYYLISVAISDYKEHNFKVKPSNSPDSIFIQNFIYNHPNILNSIQSDLEETSEFMKLFSELFGLYPFYEEKYGHCMAPLSGGMEHQTMTTQGWFSKGLTAHELAHQWFGDYVTCKSWSDIFVNEGFASYSEYLMLEHLYPEEKDGKMNSVHNNVMSQVGGSVWVKDTLDVSKIFSRRLTYNKGAAIIHTLRYLINNDEIFFNVLRTYLQNNAFNFALASDLFTLAENLSGLNLTNYKNEWFYGEGYPTYFGFWNQLDNEVIINLKHTTSKSNTPLFTNDIDLKINRQNLSDTIIRINVNSNSVWKRISINGQVLSMEIDPNNWIINRSKQMKKNPNITSISEVFKNHISIYPNPVNDVLYIDSDIQIDHVFIFSSEGKLVYQNKEKLKKYSIIISNFSIGLYNLMITNSKGIIRKKINIIK